MMGPLRVIALLVLFCGVSVAQPKAPPTAAQKTEIDRLAKRGITKGQAGDHEGAIKDLLEAYAIHPVTGNILLSNVGFEFKLLKKPHEALKYFCMCLTNDPAGPAAGFVKAETETLKKELNLTGDACAPKPEPVKVDPPKVDPPKTDPPKTDGQLTGTANLGKPTATPKSGGGLKLAGIGVGVAGAAVLAGGFVFGSKAKQKSDAISGGPPTVDASCTSPDPMVCPRLNWGPHTDRGWDGIDKLQADGEKYEKMQIAFSVVGGAMLVGGAALYFVGRSKAGTREVRVAPTASRDSTGLTLAGSF